MRPERGRWSSSSRWSPVCSMGCSLTSLHNFRSLPSEGVPASLGPRLRTAGGATRTRWTNQNAPSCTKEATMFEEPEEESKKLLLAAAIARGLQVRSWAKKHGVPERTAYRWAADPKMRSEVQAMRRRMLDRIAGAMTVRCGFALKGIVGLAEYAESETVKLNALKTILTDSMRIAKYSDLEVRMAEFEEELRRDPESFAPLPR
jgi:hypothetical protein